MTLIMKSRPLDVSLYDEGATLVIYVGGTPAVEYPNSSYYVKQALESFDYAKALVEAGRLN